MNEHPKPKLTMNEAGKQVHYSVGAIICKSGRYLLIDRANPPYGFAGVAGHIDEGEEPEIALAREVFEESGLKVSKFNLICEEELDWNTCKSGVGIHRWFLYDCDVDGETNFNPKETKSISWYTLEEMKKLKFEPAWDYWLKQLRLL